MKKIFWEFKNCGRSKDCPTALDPRLNGAHEGFNAGRACWMIAGTFCGGIIQGTYAKKEKKCIDCDFYKYVKNDEYPQFQLSILLREKLKNTT